MNIDNNIINNMTDEDIKSYIEDSEADSLLASGEYQDSKYL